MTKYAKIDDAGMHEGSMKYACDFTEKIPLVRREGVQVVLDQEEKNPQAKDFTAERFYDNSLVQELVNEGLINRSGASERFRQHDHQLRSD